MHGGHRGIRHGQRLRRRQHARQVDDRVDHARHENAPDSDDVAGIGAGVHDDVAETRRLRRAGIVDVEVASLTEQRDAVDHRGGLEAQDRVRADAQVSVDAGGVALPRSQRLPVRERRPHAGAHPMVRAMRGPYARSRGIARREQRRGRDELGAIAEQKGHAASVNIRRAPWGGSRRNGGQLRHLGRCGGGDAPARDGASVARRGVSHAVSPRMCRLARIRTARAAAGGEGLTGNT